jgi:hypothetical protein
VAAKFEQAANPVELDLNVSITAAGISCLEPTLDINEFEQAANPVELDLNVSIFPYMELVSR